MAIQQRRAAGDSLGDIEKDSMMPQPAQRCIGFDDQKSSHALAKALLIRPDADL
ncbi:hypothetical protein [Paracoccus salipaludis]|uniref:hypothetical protein n=1 Tax=Paracoccus salipaludis TaxID=2032623 RepID=UPI00143127FF|nr:hypothetical protein [Paracoccus salipaludis]